MFICLVIVGTLINFNFLTPGNIHMGASIVAFICIYISGFAYSWGVLAWLIPSEVNPIATRSAGMGIAASSNFLFTFVIGQSFLSMLCSMTYGVFYFFAIIVVIMTVLVHIYVPETKGLPVEGVYEVVQKHGPWQ